MKNSKIEWTDHTFNPWKVCTPVSPGCLNCYAAAMSKRYGWGEYKKGVPRSRNGEAYWKFPLTWNKKSLICPNGQIPRPGAPGGHGPYSTDAVGTECCECGAQLHRARVFCASLSDWLDDEAPIEWLADLLKLIHDTPNLDWLLLTKRPENWRARVGLANDAMELGSPERIWATAWAALKNPPHNVWIGATVENQAMADERIPLLVNIPARLRFLSVEPMLENINLTRLEADESLGVTYNALTGFGTWNSERVAEPIHWVIFGGESDGRACNIDWIYDGVQQCQRAGVKCFVKQLGSNAHTGNANLYDWPDSTELVASCCIEGAAAAGIKTRHRKGGDMAEWPEQLRVREVPL
jgi:protein gp37